MKAFVAIFTLLASFAMTAYGADNQVEARPKPCTVTCESVELLRERMDSLEDEVEDLYYKYEELAADKSGGGKPTPSCRSKCGAARHQCGLKCAQGASSVRWVSAYSPGSLWVLQLS